MQIIKTYLNTNEYSFVCEWRSTRNGFAHDVILLLNGYEKGRYTAHYLNRTWECFQYQTAIKCVLRDCIDFVTERATEKFKNERGYKKLTADRRKELQEELSHNAIIQDYKTLLNRADNAPIYKDNAYYFPSEV